MASLVENIIGANPNLIGVVFGAIIGFGGSLLTQWRSSRSILQLEELRNERFDQGVIRHINALLYDCAFFADSALQSGAEDFDDVGKWKRAQDRLLDRVTHTDVAVALPHSEELLHACYTCDWVVDAIRTELTSTRLTYERASTEAPSEAEREKRDEIVRGYAEVACDALEKACRELGSSNALKLLLTSDEFSKWVRENSRKHI